MSDPGQYRADRVHNCTVLTVARRADDEKSVPLATDVCFLTRWVRIGHAGPRLRITLRGPTEHTWHPTVNAASFPANVMKIGAFGTRTPGGGMTASATATSSRTS